MRKDMPTNRPGSLPMNTYLTCSFILQQNGYPESEELEESRLIDPELLIVSPQ